MRKFKCIRSYESGEWLTKGKIYTEDNGRFRYDDGWIDTTFDYDNAHFDDNNKVSDYLEEIKEDKKVSKFKVGDVVEIIRNKESTHEFKTGEVVIITEIFHKGKEGEYCRAIGKSGRQWYINYVDIKLENKVNTKTITITTSNTTTTLTDGTHTTSINRYYTDKHDDMIALEEVVKKYKSEMDEIDRVSKLPKVGDKVKVIDDRYCYSTYYQWFFENKITDECAMKWRYNHHPNNSSRAFRVVAIGKHSRDNVMIALITDDYNTYLINIEGLEVIK